MANSVIMDENARSSDFFYGPAAAIYKANSCSAMELVINRFTAVPARVRDRPSCEIAVVSDRGGIGIGQVVEFGLLLCKGRRNVTLNVRHQYPEEVLATSDSGGVPKINLGSFPIDLSSIT